MPRAAVRQFTTVVLLVSTVVAVVACAGTAARNKVLFPAIKLSWDGVKNDITMGPNQPDGLALQALDGAINSDSRANVQQVVPSVWPALQVVAEANIAAQTTWGGVRKSEHMERLKNFDQALWVLIERLE